MHGCHISNKGFLFRAHFGLRIFLRGNGDDHAAQFSVLLQRQGMHQNALCFIGMAHVAGDYPLYYDAVNEKGLCIAGLNFVGNACYHAKKSGKDNIAQFELIP